MCRIWYNEDRIREAPMKAGDSAKRTIVLYDILLKHSDESHRISMPELIAALAEQGIQADRRTVYQSLRALNESHHPVRYSRFEKAGYYAEHPFTAAQAMILTDAVQSALFLDDADAAEITRRIAGQLSEAQAEEAVRALPAPAGRTDNRQVLATIGTLLKSIHDCTPVQFRYYDMTISRQKAYRHQNERYCLAPYALILNGGRYYCVFYSEKHGGFASFRVDKMEQVFRTDLPANPKPFDLDAYLRSSFRMYSGEGQTAVIEFDLSLVNVVFDEFGQDILISAVTDHAFTAAIRTALTPTFLSWLLQFEDRCRVRRPQALIRQMLELADSLKKKYA